MLRWKLRRVTTEINGPCKSKMATICRAVDLTRFSKIAIQGTPPMAVDKEAISLSRVYLRYSKCTCHYSMCNPSQLDTCLFLFFNILTLLECTHSVDNLFHTLMVLWENENFPTSNLLCFFTSVKLCPLVIFISLILEKNIRINIFITIQYLKQLYLMPHLNLRVSSVVSPHSFNRSSYLRSLSPGMSLVALLCIISSISVFPEIWTSCPYRAYNILSEV